MSTLTISRGKVVDVDSGEIRERDIHVADGVVVDALEAPAGTSVDARGAYVAPGFIDLHTHVFSHPLFETSRLQADRIGVDARPAKSEAHSEAKSKLTSASSASEATSAIRSATGATFAMTKRR